MYPFKKKKKNIQNICHVFISSQWWSFPFGTTSDREDLPVGNLKKPCLSVIRSQWQLLLSFLILLSLEQEVRSNPIDNNKNSTETFTVPNFILKQRSFPFFEVWLQTAHKVVSF